jgi:hypothetical protein
MKCPKCGAPMEYVECVNDGIGWWVDGHICPKCGCERRGPLHIN